MKIELRRVAIYGFLVMSCAFSVKAADKPAVVVTDKTIRKFKELDRDNNGQISVDEYVARREPIHLHTRDFTIFDMDHDGGLSLAEFAPIANGVKGDVRGPISDPFVTLVDQIVMDLDVRLKNWNKRTNDEISIAEFSNALPEELSIFLNPRLVQQSDANRNGTISRAEARQFLEIQLGLRLPNGRPLRMPNGRVNNYSFFLHLDRNLNQQIEIGEVIAAGGEDDHLKKRFAESDNDGDDILSLDEWFIANWTYYDPIEDFRNLDANLDGYLDESELVKGVTDWRKTSVRFLVRAFDDDLDGKMSMNEYRLTPLSNIVTGWHRTQTDANHDRKLAIDEFIIEPPYFPMLRAFYFRRFDLNKDGYLDLTEYEFKTVKPFEMYAMNADGTDLKRLDVGNNVRFGSPAVSPDGRWIAFDGVSEYQSGFQNWQIQVMPISGGDPKAICNGVQPTWSKDGLKLACCRFQPNQGIWIVSVAGDTTQFIGSGWGTQWSPDGNKVYFTAGNSMRLYDVATKETEDLLSPQQSEYASFEMNATWSPDSKRICANAHKIRDSGISDVVLVDTTAKDRDKIKVRFSGKQIASDFAWHPDGHRIIFVMFCAERNRRQFYEFDADADDRVPTLIPGQIETKAALDITWTPDGKKLVFIVGEGI